MSAVVAGLALAGVSAIASSSAHGLLKSGVNRLALLAWAQFICMLIALPFIFWVGLPEPIILPWLFVGWILHTIYYLILIWSYNISDYSVAFPVSRGVVPIVTTFLGIALLGDALNLFAIAGVIIICFGILLLSVNQSISKSGLMVAALAGLVNAAFFLTDAKGMRVADNPANFLVWYYIMDGIVIPLLFIMRNQSNFKQAAKATAKIGMLSGILTLFAFLPSLIAFRLAPVGAVSAIRVTSVIFSLFIGSGLLKEEMSAKRIGGAILVSIGALVIIGGAALA